MKTPFDTLQRLRQRELDQARIRLAEGRDHAAAVDAASQAHARRTVAEKAAAAGAGDDARFINFGAFAADMRRTATVIEAAKAEADRRVDTLMDHATDAFLDTKAVESAADGYRRETSRRAAARDQADLDEIAIRIPRTIR